jgi:hypothetical protein
MADHSDYDEDVLDYLEQLLQEATGDAEFHFNKDIRAELLMCLMLYAVEVANEMSVTKENMLQVIDSMFDEGKIETDITKLN